MDIVLIAKGNKVLLGYFTTCGSNALHRSRIQSRVTHCIQFQSPLFCNSSSAFRDIQFRKVEAFYFVECSSCFLLESEYSFERGIPQKFGHVRRHICCFILDLWIWIQMSWFKLYPIRFFHSSCSFPFVISHLWGETLRLLNILVLIKLSASSFNSH